jgi:Ca-activated chloride channel family protein
VLLTPIALVLSALAVPIILMYVLKLRRQDFVVPSTFLWKKVLEDVQANAPWQRLRFNILLLLQLLALAALILALARPAYSRSNVISGDLVLILDQSYGMQAHDVAPNRFSAAQQRARDLASRLAGGNVMSVIGMGAQPHLAIAESSDQGAIDRAVDSLQVGIQQPSFLEALSLAASLARAGQSTRVVVLTSRDSGINTLPLNVAFPVDIVRVGGNLRDLGIIAFNGSQGASAVDAVARVGNFGSATARSDLNLLVDGRLSDVRPLTVGPHQVQNIFWNDIPAGARLLQVRLTHPDNVTTDKSAWAVVSNEPQRRVLLVSKGDYFLQTALLGDPSVRLAAVSPASYIPGMEQAYDLTIFDGVLPPSLPAGSALLVAPPAGKVADLTFGKPLQAGSVEAAGGAGALGSLLRYVDLTDVHVAVARSVSLPGWLQPLASAGGHTVLAAGQRNISRLAVVSFDLQRSDWPLRISFPIMVENLLHYLAPGLTLGQNDVTTGQSVTFFPPPGTRALKISRPGGGSDTLKPPFPPFTSTVRPGLYSVTAQTVRGNTARAAFAVNFFPSRPAPAAGPTTLHLGHAQQGNKTLTASVPVSVAALFAAVALGLLAVEWWIAFRGARLR